MNNFLFVADGEKKCIWFYKLITAINSDTVHVEKQTQVINDIETKSMTVDATKGLLYLSSLDTVKVPDSTDVVPGAAPSDPITEDVHKIFKVDLLMFLENKVEVEDFINNDDNIVSQ